MSDAGEGTAHGMWRRAGLRKLAGYGLAAAVVVALVVVLGAELARHLEAIEHWLADLGPRAPIVFVVAMALLTTVFVPDTPLALIAGALFGLERGTLVVVAGGFLGAALQYALARRWLAGVSRKLLEARPSLRGVQAAVLQDELRMQVLLRMTPLNPTLVTFVLSAAGVRFGTFLLACGALVPIWFTQVYFGYVGRHVADKAGGSKGGTWVDDALVVLGLAALIAVIVIVSRAAQRAIAAATETVAPPA